MTLPSIPDNTYKTLLYIGLVFIGYSFLQMLDSTKVFNNQVEVSNSYIDSLSIRELYQKREKERLLEIADDLSRQYKIQNPITYNDTTTFFNRTYSGKGEDVLVSDSLQDIWINFTKGNFEIHLLNEKTKMAKANLKTAEDDYDDVNYFYFSLAFLGLLLSIAGFTGMERYQNLQEKLLLLEITQKDAKYKYCQSCGRNFSSVLPHGHEANGDVNSAFCSECYESGNFKESSLTATEFKERANKILESRQSKKEKEILQKRFDHLERWRTDHYS